MYWMERLDGRKIRARLEQLELPGWRVAAAIDVDPTTFSKYVRGHLPCPWRLRRKIERVLCLRDGEIVLETH